MSINQKFIFYLSRFAEAYPIGHSKYAPGTIGSLIGVSLTWVQETYGLVQIRMTSSILNAYPVEFLFEDLLVVSGMVICVAFLASLFPGIISTSKNNFNNIKKSFV